MDSSTQPYLHIPAALRTECERLRVELRAVSAFVPATVLKQQLAMPFPGQVSGEYWQGSVLFGALTQEVLRYGGEVLKFGGDALTAFFDQTALREAHAPLAARAALNLQERMRDFATPTKPAGVFPLRLRISVHSGRVFTAQVGDTKHIIETEAFARTPTGWQLTQPVDETLVPDSIEGVITARLDRLEERSREVLQVAAVVGRRFPYRVLTRVLLQTHDLQDRLGRLTEAELILIEEIERELAYLFKHALTRDVACEAILYARRCELDRSVAREIERLYLDLNGVNPHVTTVVTDVTRPVQQNDTAMRLVGLWQLDLPYTKRSFSHCPTAHKRQPIRCWSVRAIPPIAPAPYVLIA